MILADSYWFPSFLHPYFKGRVSSKEYPFQKIRNLDELAQMLTAADCSLDQWKEWKEDISDFIAQHSDDLEKVDEFLTAMTECGIGRNPQKTMAFLVDIVTLEILTNVIQAKAQKEEISFTSIFDLALQNAAECLEPVDTSLNGWLATEWKRFRPILIYFIPNLLNIFIGAFNFLDSHKKFTTLWEKHLLLEIVYKFFIIPLCPATANDQIFNRRRWRNIDISFCFRIINNGTARI